MDIFVWNKNADKTCVKTGSYCALSEDLINFSYASGGYPPNIEHFCLEVLRGKYDDIFDFSKSFIDVGACHGVYSIELLKKFKHCYSFEANKTYSYIIGANAVANDVVDRIDIFNVYLSDREGYTRFNGWTSDVNNDNLIDAPRLTHHCYEAKYYWDKLDEFDIVNTRSLDSYNFSNIGFIKIDAEGCEFKILQGAVDTIKRNNYPPILFEMWPVESDFITDKEGWKKHCDEMIAFLENLGYKITYNVNPALDTHLAIK